METQLPQSLPNWPDTTGRAIVADSVARELKGYRERQENQDSPVWLDLPALQEAIETGTVRFGDRDLAAPPIDDSIALRAAIEALEDGIVMMFIDGKKVTDLDQTQALSDTSTVRYVKLTALRGY